MEVSGLEKEKEDSGFIRLPKGLMVDSSARRLSE